MRLTIPRRRRMSIIGVFALAVLAAPAISSAAAPAFGPTTQASAGVTVATPALIPGATVQSYGFGDESGIDTSAGSTIVWQNSGVLNAYASQGYLIVPLHLPAGTTIWQIDVYGFTTGATAQTWEFYRYPATSAPVALASASTSTGPGVVQATISPAGGVVVAPGDSLFLLVPGANSAASAYVGAIVQYTPPTLSLVPMTPVRVYDSRCTGGTIAGGASRVISVANGVNSSTCAAGPSDVLPAGAKAIAYNLTVAATTSAGYVALVPHGAAAPGTSSSNWFASGQVLANGGVVSLGGDRQLDVYAGGAAGASTQFIVDITGYYR